MSDWLYAEDELFGEDDFHGYWVDIDFTQWDSVSFVLVRTDLGRVNLSVCDDSYNELSNIRLNSFTENTNPTAIGWYTINKPAGVNSAEYYLELTGNNDGFNCYRMIIGDTDDLEQMITYWANLVPLNYFQQYDNNGNVMANTYTALYAPKTTTAQYLFWGDERLSTISLLSTDNAGLRFRIADALTGQRYYDSASDASAFRSNSLGGWASCEKVRVNTSPGYPYILEVYSTGGFLGNFLNYRHVVTIGEPRMLFGTAEAYSPSSVTGTSTAYSATASINFNSLPQTAVVDKFTLKAPSGSGVTLSKINNWRVKPSTSSIWRETGMTSTLTYPNTLARGIWHMQFKPTSSNSPLTFAPGLYVSYDYELGD